LGSGLGSHKLVLEHINYEVGSMGVGAGLYMYVIVVGNSTDKTDT